MAQITINKGDDACIYGWCKGEVDCRETVESNFGDLLSTEVNKYDKSTTYATNDNLIDELNKKTDLCKGITSEQSFISALNINDTDVDYDAEFKKYLQSRGCENEDDLAALNKFPFCKTMQDLRDFAGSEQKGCAVGDIAEMTQIPETIFSSKPTELQKLVGRADEKWEYLKNQGTYVPKELDEGELVHAMSFYEKNEINSLEDFKVAFDKQVESYYQHNKDADKSTKPDFDYDSAFDKYMLLVKSCSNAADLAAINKTEFKSVPSLLMALHGKMDTISRLLAAQGFELTEDDQAAILSNRSVSDWVNFYQSDIKSTIESFKNFLKNAPDTAQGMFDEKLKNKMIKLPSALDSLLEALDKGQAEQKEVTNNTNATSSTSEQNDNEKSTTNSETSDKTSEDKKASNITQYNASLISKYAS